MKQFWLTISGACIVVSLFFLFRRDFDTAFIVAAGGAVAWFLNYRVRMKELIALDAEQNEPDGNVDSDEEEEL